MKGLGLGIPKIGSLPYGKLYGPYAWILTPWGIHVNGYTYVWIDEEIWNDDFIWTD